MSGAFNETTFDFDDEEARIEDAIADLESEIEEIQTEIQRIKANGNDVPVTKQQRLDSLLSESRQLETHRKGVVWARDIAPESDDFPEWDEAVDAVTLGAPRGRTLRRLQSEVQQAGETNGAEQLIYIADGTVEAPYVDDGRPSAEIAGVVGNLHPWYLSWAEDRIDALMDPEGNALRSAPSHAETQTPTTSTEE